MISGSLARRYARALLGIGIEKKSYDKLGAELQQLTELLETKGLRETLKNPSYPQEKRRAILEALFARLRPSIEMRNFLLLLLERNRQLFLPAIAREYQSLADQHAGRIRARVVTAQPLDPAGSARLKQALEQKTGKQVILEQTTDSSLIAGVVTQIGSILYDGSIRTRLSQMREVLLQGQP